MANSQSTSSNLVITGLTNSDTDTSTSRPAQNNDFVLNDTSQNGTNVIIGVCVLFSSVMIATIIIALIVKIRQKAIKFVEVSADEDPPGSCESSLKDDMSHFSAEHRRELPPLTTTRPRPPPRSAEKPRLKKPKPQRADSDSDARLVQSLPSHSRTILELSQMLAAEGGMGQLKKEFKLVPVRDDDEMISEGRKAENQTKNFYPNILPFDFNRVVLATNGDEPGSDYINASKINLTREYIAAQAPRNKTRGSFWRMVAEENVRIIVNLTELMDGSRKLCSCYWPLSGKVKNFDGLCVQKEEEQDHGEFTEYVLSYKEDGDRTRREVLLLHFFQWPSKGLPQIEALLRVRQRLHELSRSDDVVLVHCSAGAGRTGAFIALDTLLDEGSKTGSVDVLRCVSQLRMARPHLIQTTKQYIFLHQCIVAELALV